MDKKTKKKLSLLNQRLQVLRQQLAGAKRQEDEPGEIKQLEAAIVQLETEVQALKGN